MFVERKDNRRGFTIIELLVVITIIGVLVGLLLPAVQSARSSARVLKCQNNLKQLATAMNHYVESNGELPAGARTWVGDPYGGPGGFYDDHGWYSPIGAFIDELAWYNKIDFGVSFSHPNNDAARRKKIALYACPEDGLKENEWHSTAWARVRGNYCVNFGNTNYGQKTKSGIEFLGAPFGYRRSAIFSEIRDGASNTLMMSECLTTTEVIGGYWGGTISEQQTSLGGQTFETWLTPNSKVGDEVVRIDYNRSPWNASLNGMPMPAFIGGDTTIQVFAARSHHPGGVSASFCDGSVRFVNEFVDLATWRAMSTAWGEELYSHEDF